MDLSDVKQLMELMKKHDLIEVELEYPEDGPRIRLKKAAPVMNSHPVVAPSLGAQPIAEGPMASAPVVLANGVVPAPAPVVEEEHANLVEVPSPMVGTFYRATSPDSDPFVEVGDTIDEESVVCIIEAMKVMNEMKGEVAGEVVEILVQNGEAVEYGQPLFLIRTDEEE